LTQALLWPEIDDLKQLDTQLHIQSSGPKLRLAPERRVQRLTSIITRPCYASRELVSRAIDVKMTARAFTAVDRAIEANSADLDGFTHRRFYNVDQTNRWDWPNFQRAYPWRVWFDEREIADVTVNPPVVYTGSGGHSTPVLIAASDIFWGPWNYSPPFTFLELDRSSNAAFGYSATPQRDIAITATFGYALNLGPAGALGAAVSSTTVTTIQVTNSFSPGVGDVVTIDSERMLVTDRAMVTTGQTQQGSGCSTVSMADNALAVTDGTKFSPDEIVLLDTERMLVLDVAGNTLTVERAFDGTVLAVHSGATIYSPRLLTVTRGDFGTVAATHLIAAPVQINIPPSEVRDYVVAASLVQVLAEIGGYADVQGSGSSAMRNVGRNIAQLQQDVIAHHGRKARSRVV